MAVDFNLRVELSEKRLLASSEWGAKSVASNVSLNCIGFRMRVNQWLVALVARK